MRSTDGDLQQLIDKWSEKARGLWYGSEGDVRAANAYFNCVDDLIGLITPTVNELRSGA